MHRSIAFGAVVAFTVAGLGCPEQQQHATGYPPPGYGQGAPGQPQPGQPHAGQPGQPYPGQPGQPGQPYPGQPYPGQAYPGQAYPGQRGAPVPGPKTEPYPQYGYAMPNQASGTGQGATQPQRRPTPRPAGSMPPYTAPTKPLAPFGPADPGGSAVSIELGHVYRALPALDQLAARNMINLTAYGDPVAAQFNNGQVYETTFEIEPGRCYGAVAVGMGITELDLAIVLGTPPVDHVMGADALKGPQAVVGPSGKCIVNTLPTPDEAKLVMTAVTGAGTATARIYAK